MLTLQTPQNAAGATEKEYCEVHDAYYNATLDVWLESACSDPDCHYCATRPEKPSQVVRNLD